MSVMMPRGIVRACALDCGYRAYTLHTEAIPCSTPGCGGSLAWPKTWPHVCPNGHPGDLEVVIAKCGTTESPFVPVTECSACRETKKQRRSPHP